MRQLSWLLSFLQAFFIIGLFWWVMPSPRAFLVPQLLVKVPKQEDPALHALPEQTGLPLYGIICPDKVERDTRKSLFVFTA